MTASARFDFSSGVVGEIFEEFIRMLLLIAP
jgi:hypothetical protein